MKNAAYCKEYLSFRQEQEKVFCAGNLICQDMLTLSPLYRRKKSFYSGMAGGYPIHATENELQNEAETVLFTWRNINDDGDFCKIIGHRDGESYMIFRSDLYGYSVLNLATMQVFYYIPSDSFPQGESFIFTDVHYNHENNKLAVSGCYWACPYGVLILDFSRPMDEPVVWADVHKHVADGFGTYDDIDFVEWRGRDLLLNAYNHRNECVEFITITENQYMEWL